ncbi:MAG: indole-3-glycerol phosphate synthase TrpC [Phycisphaerales bacterium]
MHATTPMIPVLKHIVEHKRREVAEAKRAVPLETLRERISELGRPRNFFRSVVDDRHPGAMRIIAEVKRKSPSAGVIREDFDPVAIAKSYFEAGAAAISCLTDREFFGGDLSYIHAIRDAVPLPVLRKDFIIDPYQVYEARAAGADAILLIAECLHESEIIDFQILATELQMTTLLEVHQLESLWRAVNHVGFPHSGYGLLGVNNRDLETMKTDIRHVMRVADMVEAPLRRVLVAESGIQTPADLARLRSHGVHIALVGESLMRQPDPGAALRALLSDPA